MRISWNWLKTLADLDGITPQEAADVLTSTGLEVEHVDVVEPVKGMLAGVVVGQVLECAKHPDADRLSVCRVDLGTGETAQIICGAPNVAAGQKVLVATVGSTLHMADGSELTIKKAKIRGVESHGMICAEDELGLGTSHEGILVLDPGSKVGMPAAEHLGLRTDHAFEIGLTPNRADAMGHLGVARDLVAALNFRHGSERRVHLPDVSAFATDGPGRSLRVTVDDPHMCPRYTGLTLTGVMVGPSPAWLQERLLAIGLKPINNVVDVTNFVQHELGQPLHAFDADRIADDHVLVKHLPEGTAFTTLDGVERKLSAEDLMIADVRGGLCVAGVFGGQGSGVTEATKAVFLESACFEAVSIRRTAKRHGLHTDASFRFERGVDPELALTGLKRAALLLKEITGATLSDGVVDLYPHPAPPREVRLRFARVDRLCGAPVAPDDVVRVLELLDCRIAARDGEGVTVAVPGYRVDVHREADLVEEVLRIHGYDRIPLPEQLMLPAVVRPELSAEGFQEQVALHLAARGFREVMTPSLVNGELAVKLEAAVPQALVRLKNPLSAELDVLRPTMLFGMLAAASHNLARQRRDLRLFEQGRVYGWKEGRSEEQERTALLLTGSRWREGWRTKARATERADALEEVELLLRRMGAWQDVTLHAIEQPLLHGAVELRAGDRVLAQVGEVLPTVRAAFDVEQPVFVVELHDAALRKGLGRSAAAYAEVPRFPAVRRDLSLLLDKGVRFQQLKKLAFHAERKLLREVDLFDVYEGDKLPSGKKSYALRFVLQDEARTLTDQQVDKAMSRIRKAFEEEVGAELRG